MKQITRADYQKLIDLARQAHGHHQALNVIEIEACAITSETPGENSDTFDLMWNGVCDDEQFVAAIDVLLRRLQIEVAP